MLESVISVAERGGEGAICCMLAAAEFVGAEEEGPGLDALVRCDVVRSIVLSIIISSSSNISISNLGDINILISCAAMW